MVTGGSLNETGPPTKQYFHRKTAMQLLKVNFLEHIQS